MTVHREASESAPEPSETVGPFEGPESPPEPSEAAGPIEGPESPPESSGIATPGEGSEAVEALAPIESAGAEERRFDRWERRVREALASLRSWLPLALAIAAGTGLFAWAIAHGKPGFVLDNKLSRPERLQALAALGGSIVVFALAYATVGRWRRRRGAGWIDTFRGLNKALLPLLALPLIVPLLVPKIEVDRPFLTLAIAVALAAVAAVAAYQARWPLAASRTRWAWLALGVVMAAYAVGLSWLALVQHWGLATATYDLGIYDNIFWQSIHGKPLGSSFVKSGSHVAAHVDPLLVILSPLYLLYPRAEFLLVFQSIWLALGAIPLFWLARRFLGSPWLALAFACIYLLYPALHGANLYDFHSLTLAAPLLILAIATIEAERPKAYAVALALLLLTREDMALLACFVALYAIVSRQTRLGLVTIAVSIAYFAFLKLFVMPDASLLMKDSKEAYGYAYYYKDLIPHGGEGALGIVISMLVNPIFTFVHAFSEAKVLLALRLFLPLLFLPFLAGWRAVVLAYGFAFIFLSSRTAVHSLHFQYTVLLFPLAMAIAPRVLAELPGRRWFDSFGLEPHRAIRAVTIGCLAATIVVSAKYGATLPNAAFRGGFSKLVRSLTPAQRETHAWVRQTVALIPPDATVSATGRLGPHVSNRRGAFVFPAEADYAFVDGSNLDRRGKAALERLKSEKGYGKLAERGNLSLWGPPPSARAPEPSGGS